MADELAKHYLENAISEFRLLKKQGERAMEQLADEEFFVTLDPESNSIAILVKLLAGNMRSRWTDLFTTDGEKPARNRDGEFEAPPATRAALMALWEDGWAHRRAAEHLHRLRPWLQHGDRSPWRYDLSSNAPRQQRRQLHLDVRQRPPRLPFREQRIPEHKTHFHRFSQREIREIRTGQRKVGRDQQSPERRRIYQNG